MAGGKKADRSGTQLVMGNHQQREKHMNNISNYPKHSTYADRNDKEADHAASSPLHNFYKTLIGVIVILFILSFISGQKWNEMKRASYYTSKRQLIAQGARIQTVGESYLIASIYGMTTLGFIALSSNPFRSKKKSLSILIAVGALLSIVLSFIFISAILKYKRKSYPYAYNLI